MGKVAITTTSWPQTNKSPRMTHRTRSVNAGIARRPHSTLSTGSADAQQGVQLKERLDHTIQANGPDCG
jgi:hypothetical protein